jgi:hypothetical protein
MVLAFRNWSWQAARSTPLSRLSANSEVGQNRKNTILGRGEGSDAVAFPYLHAYVRLGNKKEKPGISLTSLFYLQQTGDQ